MQILNYNLEAYVPYDEDNIEKLLTLCEEAVDNITSDERPKFRLKSAIHELIINSLEHGYKKNSGKVSVSLKKESDSIIFEICDEGYGLDPSRLDLNRQVTDLEEATPRGWGLTILNTLADNLQILPNYPQGTKVSLKISLV